MDTFDPTVRACSCARRIEDYKRRKFPSQDSPACPTCTCSDVGKALGAVNDALENDHKWQITISIGRAVKISHYPGESPEYFEIGLWYPKRTPWSMVHETIVKTIRQNFGQLGEYRDLPMRYIEVEKDDDDSDDD